MARAHFVQKARKAIKGTDIKKGDSYWWWKFRHGSKHTSKTQPRPSQLTQSDFYSRVYAAQEAIEDCSASDEVRDVRDSVASDLRELGEECQGKHDNMPESLQQGDTGQLLEERAQVMEAAADELESLELDDPDDSDLDEIRPTNKQDGESKAKYEQRLAENRADASTRYWESKLEELQAVSIDAP